MCSLKGTLIQKGWFGWKSNTSHFCFKWLFHSTDKKDPRSLVRESQGLVKCIKESAILQSRLVFKTIVLMNLWVRFENWLRKELALRLFNLDYKVWNWPLFFFSSTLYTYATCQFSKKWLPWILNWFFMPRNFFFVKDKLKVLNGSLRFLEKRVVMHRSYL